MQLMKAANYRSLLNITILGLIYRCNLFYFTLLKYLLLDQEILFHYITNQRLLYYAFSVKIVEIHSKLLISISGFH